MDKIQKLKALEKCWNDSEALRVAEGWGDFVGPMPWDDLVSWWEENRINWEDEGRRGITAKLSSCGMSFFFDDGSGVSWDCNLEDSMQEWIELPKKFAEDYCLYVNNEKRVTAIAHQSLAKEFLRRSLLPGGEWLGLQDDTEASPKVRLGGKLRNREKEKLLFSLGSKFRDGNFTEEEFVQHAMSLMKEESPLS